MKRCFRRVALVAGTCATLLCAPEQILRLQAKLTAAAQSRPGVPAAVAMLRYSMYVSVAR